MTFLVNPETLQLIMVPRGRQHDAIVRCLEDSGAHRLESEHLAGTVQRALRLHMRGMDLGRAVDLALRTLDPPAAG